MAGKVDGIHWHGNRHNSSRNDLRSLWSIKNALSKHRGYCNSGFRFCIRYQVLAIVGVQVFCWFRDIWRVHTDIYIVRRVCRSSISAAFTDNYVVRFYCRVNGPSVDGVLCKNVENTYDIVRSSLDFRLDFLEVSGIRFCVIEWATQWVE